MAREDEKYIRLLAQSFRNEADVCTEITNLQAVLRLPKGTEHFVSDIHGAFDSFSHVLKNASGVIKNYIDELFGATLLDAEKRNLATLIYYPAQKLAAVRDVTAEESLAEWYKVHLFRMLVIAKRVASKYTCSRVREALPAEFGYVLEELIHESADKLHKAGYYNEIMDSVIRLGRAEALIVALSQVIQRLAVDHLHVIGDIYDRGNGADKIMDVLEAYHSVDVQWGNHDISWMGAASGSDACICNVIRVSARYNNLHTIEEGYGINLVPLAMFAMEKYAETDCARFAPENWDEAKDSEQELRLIAMMHKAITMMQFKMEAAVIRRNPAYGMEDRLLLHRVDAMKRCIEIDGVAYPMADAELPTVDWAAEDPYALTEEEAAVMEKLRFSFTHSEKLQRHTRFLFNKGGMYRVFNNNLLFHGCVPMEADGTCKEVVLPGMCAAGRLLLDEIEASVRRGRFAPRHSAARQEGLDLMWYLWCGADSPLYGKDKMATFERLLIGDERLYEEAKDAYYELRNEEETCRRVLEDFGLDPETARIVNGHVPVKVNKGESPVKANGRLVVIDGGFAKAYQQVTGIAGYTLISNSQGLLLASHEPFVSTANAIENELDIVSNTAYIEVATVRRRVGDTDTGRAYREKIADLELLLAAYRSGAIQEQSGR